MRGFRQWKWHLDEMVYLWRAVDHEGEVLESYITKTRDKAAALPFMKKTLKQGTILGPKRFFVAEEQGNGR